MSEQKKKTPTQQSSSSSSSSSGADARYAYDENRLQQLKTSAPWMKDPKYFVSVALSPSAVMKIMMHCQTGVEKGVAKGGNPIEVMGMLLGRPDPDTPTTLVVTDAFPLPIEGFETRVIADDENVVNHMIALGESLERSRKEKFMGWYHSHPFDLGDHSHCFLSQTDLSTQLQWQRAEDPHGNPFVAIVVDPLRSAHTQEPELKAFRAYPPEYNSPVSNQCPDGSVEPSEQVRLEHWGSCWNRYYELKVEYYMSSTSRGVMEQLTQDYLWMRTLNGRSDNDLTQKIVAAGKQFHTASTTSPLSSSSPSASSAAAAAAAAAATKGPSSAPSSSSSGGGGGGRYASVSASAPAGEMMSGGMGPSPAPRGGGGGGGFLGSMVTLPGNNPRTREWNKAVETLADVAEEELCEKSLQKVKEQVFG